MSLLHKFAALGGNPATTYVDDVFSAYTYTGNSSTQTITNGIDLSGKSGLVWIKGRDAAYTHGLYDTARGAPLRLSSETTAANITDTGSLTAFTSTGFSLGSISNVNQTGVKFASWTFRKAPKFFDVVTFTTNGSGVSTFSHSLGSVPGMVIIKNTGSAENWSVYHRMMNGGTTPGNYYMVLNSTAAQVNFGSTWATPTASDMTVSGFSASASYVAYLFAHDTATDGLIQCGSFTTDGSGNATVSLGWEPQFAIIKGSSGATNWLLLDQARGWTAPSGNDAKLNANDSAAEVTTADVGSPTATGFTFIGGASSTYIYMAIRRPNKPPTTGTQVYNAIARTGTLAAATVTGVGFAPDLFLNKTRSGTTGAPYWFDRLRGINTAIDTTSTNGDVTYASSATSFDMDGWQVGTSATTNNTFPLIQYFFKRAPGVFDEVCFTGTGANLAVSHNLGVAPELVISKRRSGADSWWTYASGVGNTKALVLESTAGSTAASAGYWNNTTPTTTTVTFGTTTNLASSTYVAYLFATKAGISKVFSYTGNGSSQTINCGFTTGARWVMIKRTDSTGGWYVWDSTRGIVAGNDPHLSLNTTAAEVTTDDSVDTDTTGFVVNQLAATNINVTSATYIGLAFA